jgi:D-glycero-D-manno-heptose 1,7-bisphosphate phosphatase
MTRSLPGAALGAALPRAPRLVLFDRDGTLVVDVPYNADPAVVTAMPTAKRAVARVRAAGIPVGVVTNQSGIGRGIISRAEVDSVNRAIDAMFGGFDSWQVCPHSPDDHCACRKPEPGMIEAAARDAGVESSDVVVIGDIGSDVEAARAAGAMGILVPTPVTRREERAAADFVATTLDEAIDVVESAVAAAAREAEASAARASAVTVTP